MNVFKHQSSHLEKRYANIKMMAISWSDITRTATSQTSAKQTICESGTHNRAEYLDELDFSTGNTSNYTHIASNMQDNPSKSE